MSAFRLLPLAAFSAILLVAAPSAGRATHERSPVPSIADHLDRSQALAASAVALLGLASLAAIPLMSRRQRSYFERR